MKAKKATQTQCSSEDKYRQACTFKARKQTKVPEQFLAFRRNSEFSPFHPRCHKAFHACWLDGTFASPS